MDSVKPSALTPTKSKLARTLAKVLHLRAVTGIAPVDGIHKVKDNHSQEAEKNKVAWEALLAKLFASISSLKSAYAQLQHAQSPYDADGIQAADQMVISELTSMSEFKQCYLKKQIDPSPETTLILAEIQELKSVSKMYEIMGKKLESQLKLKESEITSHIYKLEEIDNHNRLIGKRLNQSGQLYMLENLQISGLNPSHFISVLHHTVKSIKTFVKLMMAEMKSTGWDVDRAARAIDPDVVFRKADHKCLLFESFVCQKMFDSFHYPNFNSLPNEPLSERNKLRQHFFNRFKELKSVKVGEFLDRNPSSAFAQFCRARYLRLVHPKMESSFFGNLKQRTHVNSGRFPETNFFALFAEMAKRVWLLHCLAFSFDPEASIFQVSKGDRFSEVYMESIAEEEAFHSPERTSDYDLQVAFTIVPGFRIGKSVIQCLVYFSHFRTRHHNH